MTSSAPGRASPSPPSAGVVVACVPPASPPSALDPLAPGNADTLQRLTDPTTCPNQQYQPIPQGLRWWGERSEQSQRRAPAATPTPAQRGQGGGTPLPPTGCVTSCQHHRSARPAKRQPTHPAKWGLPAMQLWASGKLKWGRTARRSAGVCLSKKSSKLSAQDAQNAAERRPTTKPKRQTLPWTQVGANAGHGCTEQQKQPRSLRPPSKVGRRARSARWLAARELS